MPHFGIGSAGGAVLIRTSGSGRAFAVGGAVLRDPAPPVQSMAMGSIAATATFGSAYLAFAPFGWRLAIAGSAGGMLVKGASSQRIGAPGALVRGVDLGLQTMAAGSIAAVATFGSSLLRRATDSKIVVAAGGSEPALLAGPSGYHFASPGSLVRMPGPANQTMLMLSIAGLATFGAATLTVGRLTYRFNMPGMTPANPIGFV